MPIANTSKITTMAASVTILVLFFMSSPLALLDGSIALCVILKMGDKKPIHSLSLLYIARIPIRIIYIGILYYEKMGGLDI